MAGGAPKGSRNAAKGKAFYDALRKECVQSDALPKLAKILLAKALEGEQWAMQEVANRFDGKPAQAMEVSGPDGDAIETVTRIERVIVKPGDAE